MFNSVRPAAKYEPALSVPAGNGQVGRAPDSREIIPSSSPDRRHFYYFIGDESDKNSGRRKFQGSAFTTKVIARI